MSLRQFLQAAVRGDVSYLSEHVQTFAGQRDEAGRTGLMLSALNQQVASMQVLKDYEEGQRDSRGATALMYVAGSGCTQGVKLLSQGCELGAQTPEGITAAMCAAACGHSGCLKHLKQEMGLQNSMGQTALMIAAAQGHVEAVAALKDKEFYLRDARGKNALMYACAAGKLDAVQILLCNEDLTELDPDHPYHFGEKTEDNKTALRFAFQAMEQVATLGENEARDLAAAAFSIASALFDEEKAEVTGPEQLTTLMLAAKFGADEFVVKLLDSQQNAQDVKGMTALMYAAQAGHVSTIRHLIDREQRAQDKQGKTALMYAVEAGELDAAQALLQQEYQVKDQQGNTILHIAAASGAVEVVSVVKKLFSNQTNLGGDPALFLALRHKQLPCARLLLEEANIIGSDGKTALMVAAAAGASEIVEHLLSKQRGKQDKNSWTASAWAAFADQLEILPRLISSDGAKGYPVLFAAVEGDAVECTKFLADIARTGRSEMFSVTQAPPDLVKFAKKQMELRAKKIKGIADGDNALQHAARLGKSAAVRILAPVLRQPELYPGGFTPLMLAASTTSGEHKLTKEAVQALCLQFGGRQLTVDQPGTRVGATALMIGSMLNVDNIDILAVILPFERDCRDADGRQALDYARAGDRQDVIALLRAQ